MKKLSVFLSLGVLFIGLSSVAEACHRCRAKTSSCDSRVTYSRPTVTYYYVRPEPTYYTYTRTTYTEINITYRSTTSVSYSSRGGYFID